MSAEVEQASNNGLIVAAIAVVLGVLLSFISRWAIASSISTMTAAMQTLAADLEVSIGGIVNGLSDAAE